ncbi:MAG: hypothetical protein H6810_00655 [Phycisphaeraceae bacterium]|nr:MAG: hypothetical protein H6810_00655 [Phycisphaeraceae bacterium]
MSNSANPIPKPCVICGLDLAGEPRVKDAKGHYVCKAFAENRRPCERARHAVAKPQAAPEAPLDDLAALARAEAAAVGEMRALTLEPEPDLAPDHALACPVCARPFVDESESCAGCGYKRDLGIKSSLYLKKSASPNGRTVICPKCKYDMGAGASIICPECGTKAQLETARAKERRVSASIARQAYMQPLITFLVCSALMLAFWAYKGATTGVIWYAVGVPIELALGWLAYTTLCVLFLGFDAPQHLILLRLAAVYAATDVAFTAAGFIPIPVLPWVFALLTYISLLMYYLEMDMADAFILIVATFIAKIGAMAMITLWLMGLFA